MLRLTKIAASALALRLQAARAIFAILPIKIWGIPNPSNSSDISPSVSQKLPKMMREEMRKDLSTLRAVGLSAQITSKSLSKETSGG